MGKRGPARKPVELAILHGDQKCRINTDAPVAAEGDPVPAYPLSTATQAVWDRTLDHLRAMGTLSSADGDVITSYCEAVVMLERTSKELGDPESPTSALLIPGVKGGMIRNPVVSMQRDYAVLVRVLAREFGLTPSARSEITVSKPDAGSASGPERLLS